jgi:transposase-like protein
MKANIKTIRKIRRYSEEFKRQLVKEYENGKFSVCQLEALHGISNASIYSWIYKFSTFNKKGYRIVEHKNSSKKKLTDLESKIKELEAALGRKQIMIDYLETMMEVAKEELNFDIKKNYNTQQSKGLKEGGKK